jgi:hypothetical protein
MNAEKHEPLIAALLSLDGFNLVLLGVMAAYTRDVLAGDPLHSDAAAWYNDLAIFAQNELDRRRKPATVAAELDQLRAMAGEPTWDDPDDAADSGWTGK